MQVYHPSRRFEFVAVEILEISLQSRDGNRKVIVMGDMFTRFMMAVPVCDETAATVASTLLDRWILLFGPPEKLLSDRGKVFLGDFIRRICRKVGTKKIFTTGYHPQTDGCIERFNRTLCTYLKKFVLDEADWDHHVAMATFRYNSSVHRATKCTPHSAMFGVDVFEFDAGIGLQVRLEDEPEDLAERLAAVHKDLLAAGKQSRTSAAKHYDKAVLDTKFEIGDRVLIYNPPGDVEVGRKLRVPWIGPHRITEKHSPVGYSMVSEIEGKRARAHVNRLRKIAPETLAETANPEAGLWPDSRRLLRGSLGRRTTESGQVQYQVKHAGRAGFVWQNEESLPDVVKAAY
jgi:Integrase core domain